MLKTTKFLQSKEFVNCMELIRPHFDGGLMMDIFDHGGALKIQDYIIQLILISFLDVLIKNKNQVRTDDELFTVEFPLLDKKMTFNAKWSIFNNNTPLINSLQILVQVLTTNEKDYKPFWNTVIEKKSKNLWLPIKTDFVDLDSNSFNSLLNYKMVQSPFWMEYKIINPQNKNLQMTSYPLSMSLIVDNWENDGIKKIIKNHKVKIYPNKQEKMMFKKWFGTYRFVYNRFINYIENNQNDNERFNFYKMRNKFVIHKNNHLINEWEIETPKDIRADSIKSCISAYKSNFTKLKNNQQTHFKMRYKSKKQKTQCMTIPKTAIKTDNDEIDGFYFYKRFLKSKVKIKKRTKKRIKQKEIKFEHDCKLLFDGMNYYLLIPYKVNKKKFVSKNEKILSFDPGVRTFQTGYSNDEVFKVSRNDLILKLYNKIDNLRSVSKTKKISKYSQRIKNIVNDIHWKTIDYIIKNKYNKVFLPHFENQEMVKKHTLCSKTNRLLMSLSHYKFKERLKHKCDEFGIILKMVNESYTSKTCGSCGKINNNLNGSKLFKCPNCKIEMDRDINGARNIMLKNI